MHDAALIVHIMKRSQKLLYLRSVVVAVESMHGAVQISCRTHEVQLG